MGPHFLSAIVLVPWLACGASLSAMAAQAPVGTSPRVLESTIRQHCLVCHNDRTRTADLSLAAVTSTNVGEQALVLEKVLRKLRAGEMPPAGRPALATETVTELVGWLETELDGASAASPNPGTPAIQRLNRAEYTNAVHDLLGLNLDHARDLPADDSGYGFDNIGDVLTVSPLHIEKYISTARRISRLAVGTARPRAVVEKYERSPGVPDAAVEGLPLGERGGMLFEHYFPFDADYTITVRVRGRRQTGMPSPQLDLRVDGRRVRLFDASFDNAEVTQGTRNFELRLPFEAGAHVIGAGFLAEYAVAEIVSENADSRPGPGYLVDYVLVGGPFNTAGPGATESRRRLLECHSAADTDGTPCASRILTTVARRAYRRPVTAIDIEPLVSLFREGQTDGGSFEHGIEMALSGVLVSPSFLFRAPGALDEDGTRTGRVSRLTDIDLASRLSFFLWSSIPDEALLSLAERGRLSEPDVLTAQIHRMLSDPKSSALVDNFAGQWLHLRNVAEWAPDPERYPHFDESLRYAFQRETELFLEHVIRDDRSVLELVAADYTFANERLAAFYGLEGVRGGYFRRVSLDGTPRGGIVTHASVLMVTSYPTRTSPVLRGKWVLENLLGAPPPPPPPDVPALPAAAETSAGGLRDALEQHRASPTCSACHAKLDPLGFALENFDGVGAYRTDEDGMTIDASGALPDGTLVSGPRGLQRVLLARRVEFVETLADRLLTYALGRGLEYYDRPAVREIRRRVEAADYRFSALVEAIVDSVPFRLRGNSELPPER